MRYGIVIAIAGIVLCAPLVTAGEIADRLRNVYGIHQETFAF